MPTVAHHFACATDFTREQGQLCHELSVLSTIVAEQIDIPGQPMRQPGAR
jgi:hypothetical protein